VSDSDWGEQGFNGLILDVRCRLEDEVGDASEEKLRDWQSRCRVLLNATGSTYASARRRQLGSRKARQGNARLVLLMLMVMVMLTRRLRYDLPSKTR
jgi:hypothetical protein